LRGLWGAIRDSPYVLLTRAVTGNAGVNEGDLLFGKYRVERVIGSGGMGIVVAARHEELDQLVAIKFIREELLGHPDAARRFLREARAAAKLKSEHVARVLDVGMLESGAPYMIMEFLEGSDLAKILAESGPMAPTYALPLFRQACTALAEAHAAGIVHRDLKPQNLFLTHIGGSPRVKVLDFGIAKTFDVQGKAAHALTRTAAVLGSPLYMAPEQILSSRDVDARVDVWSLGVVLFELLTARWPFEADTYPALCVKIANGVPCRLSDFRQDVPLEVVAIIERCLEKDATKRFANAAEIAKAIDALPLEVFPPSRDVHRRGGGPPLSVESARGALRKLDSTPAGWDSVRDGRAAKTRRLAAGTLLLTTAAIAAGFVISRRSGARPDPARHPASAIELAPAVAANSSMPEPRSGSPDILPPSSSEGATRPQPPTTGSTAKSVPSPPERRVPSASLPATPTTSTSLGLSEAVDGDGIPLRRTSPPKRSVPGLPSPAGAATVSARATATTVDEIPSRR
jgi:serine/threonine protein kinase